MHKCVSINRSKLHRYDQISGGGRGVVREQFVGNYPVPRIITQCKRLLLGTRD